MITKTLIFISDFDLKGSGYLQVSVPLCKGLAKLGYKIFAVGINYDGQEHDFPFTIIPCKNFQDAHAMVHNLSILEHPEVMIVALDLPHQGFFLERKHPEVKYICITPLENPPLTMSWAAPLLNADGVFFISQIATDAAHRAGILNAEHIQIGIDDNWKMPNPEEKTRIRKGLGVDDKFVVLTVADNQERKNLWAALGIICMYVYDLTWEEFEAVAIKHTRKISEFEKKNTDVKYTLITREHLTFGYRLRDFCTEMGINEEVFIVERGMPFDMLWAYYAASDMFLLTSKAEGLCLPIMESMACGVPVMATDTGAIPELLSDGRGFPIPTEYTFRDVWGNGKRDMVNIQIGAELLRDLMQEDLSETIKRAKEFTNSRQWSVAVEQLANKIEQVTNEQKTPEQN